MDGGGGLKLPLFLMGNMARQLVQIGLRVEKLTRCGRGGKGREGRGRGRLRWMEGADGLWPPGVVKLNYLLRLYTVNTARLSVSKI